MSFGQLKPIVGGQPVETHEFPFVVYLNIETQPSWHAVCGGTLISDRHILTAGHCLFHAPSAHAIKIGYGHTHVRQQRTVRALRYTIHPEFNPRTLFNDIAIIELAPKDRIKSSATAHRIPIYFGQVDQGLVVTTMGWGITSNTPGAHTVPVMNRVDLSVASNEVCTRVDGSFASSNGPFVCTNTMPGGKDECNGDSGSPAVITMVDGRAIKSNMMNTHRGWGLLRGRNPWHRRKGQRSGGGADMRLVALTSYGDNINHDVHPACGDPEGLGFSTHIAYYVDFVTNTTGLTRQQLEQPIITNRQASVHTSDSSSLLADRNAVGLSLIIWAFLLCILYNR